MIRDVKANGKNVGTVHSVTFIRDGEDTIHGISVTVNVWDEEIRRQILTGLFDVNFEDVEE
jgi:hypothetical protein